MDIFREMEKVKVKREKPVKPVKIGACQHTLLTEPYKVKAEPAE